MALGAGDVKIIRVIPVIDTAAYTSGDQLGGLMTLTQAAPDDMGGCVLASLSVLDKGKQKKAMTVFIFSAAPTLTSVNNGVLNITDANSTGIDLGNFQILSTDYKDMTGNSRARSLSAPLPCAPAAGVNLYAVAMIEDSPTYAVGDLEFTFNFLQGSGR